MKTPDALSQEMVDLSESLQGHLAKTEVRFLSCIPFLKSSGSILEIGSFKGKSTIILARASKEISANKIIACDPLLLDSTTDPQGDDPRTLPNILFENLRNSNVADYVEFHQKKSQELATTWSKELKALWIDGDHTYLGVTTDIDLFYPFLSEGAIVCLHDVLHGREGSIRAFIERIVLSNNFPVCGCCGSIGWGIYTKKNKPTIEQWKQKLKLYRKLSVIVPYTVKATNNIPCNRLFYKIARLRIPHGEISSSEWVNEINSITSSWG